jgi:hypothetical protein
MSELDWLLIGGLLVILVLASLVFYGALENDNSCSPADALCRQSEVRPLQPLQQ